VGRLDTLAGTRRDTVAAKAAKRIAKPKKATKSAKKKATRRRRAERPKSNTGKRARVAFPLNTLETTLRIPKAILGQHAGKKCSDKQAAEFLGLATAGGAFGVELGSAIKYGVLKRPEAGHVELTDLGRKILKPQRSEDELEGRRQAVIETPVLGAVYKHYRGENLPDKQFLRNALVDTFEVPEDRVDDFEQILVENLRYASLLSEEGGAHRVLDVSESVGTTAGQDVQLKSRGKSSGVRSGDSCFVMQPFSDPLGSYYKKIFEPAIEKAGMRAMRADDDIFSTGKVIDQIWRGIDGSKVLVAELTSRNPNVFYELGLAHALKKPVVLVSSSEEDVPFDLRHIRVIYYDTTDPFWGQKLIDKVAENIVSALENPEEALFETLLS
jgi:hypothetical protein